MNYYADAVSKGYSFNINKVELDLLFDKAVRSEAFNNSDFKSPARVQCTVWVADQQFYYEVDFVHPDDDEDELIRELICVNFYVPATGMDGQGRPFYIGEIVVDTADLIKLQEDLRRSGAAGSYKA